MDRISNVVPLVSQKLTLTENSISDLPKCSFCSDTGFELIDAKARLCRCRLKRIADAKIEKIPPAFRDYRLATIQPRGDAKQASVINAMRTDPTGSFFLAGSFGCGKSLLMWTLYREAVESGRRKIVAMTLTELLNEFKAFIQASINHSDPIPPSLSATELRQNETPYSIFLDDIDKARPTEYAAEQFFEIVNATYDFGHQVVVTTNLGIDALKEHFNRADPRFGGAIVRRLTANAKCVEMF